MGTAFYVLGGVFIFASEINAQNVTDEIVDKLLFDELEYMGEKADVAVVLGSQKACEYRVAVASEIYHSGKIGKLIFCGGKVQDTKYGLMPEYESMIIAAKEHKIPKDCIFTEENSTSTVENLENAKVIIDNIPNCKNVILITTSYHMRRAMKIAEIILSEYKVIPCPANDNSTRRNNWFKTDKGRRIALDECMKFGYYIENKYIKDFEI